jgi:hypothetical protein
MLRGEGVNDQYYTPVPLPPRKQNLIYIEWEAGHVMELVWMYVGEGNFVLLPESQSKISRSFSP